MFLCHVALCRRLYGCAVVTGRRFVCRFGRYMSFRAQDSIIPLAFPDRQAVFCMKLCLSVPFSGFQPPFWAPSGREMPQTLPVCSAFGFLKCAPFLGRSNICLFSARGTEQAEEPICWRVLFRQHQAAAYLRLAEMPDSVQVLGYALLLL